MLDIASQVNSPTITDKILENYSKVRSLHHLNNVEDFKRLQQLDHESSYRHMNMFTPQVSQEKGAESMLSEDDTFLGDHTTNNTTNTTVESSKTPWIATAILATALAAGAGGLGASYLFNSGDKEVNVDKGVPSAVGIYRDEESEDEK